MVLAPEHSDAQVQILALIVRTMLQPEVREQLIHTDDPDAIWSVFAKTFASQHVIKTGVRRRR